MLIQSFCLYLKTEKAESPLILLVPQCLPVFEVQYMRECYVYTQQVSWEWWQYLHASICKLKKHNYFISYLILLVFQSQCIREQFLPVFESWKKPTSITSSITLPVEFESQCIRQQFFLWCLKANALDNNFYLCLKAEKSHLYIICPVFVVHCVPLAGNKCDVNGDRVVRREDGERLAREYNVAFMETSAKTGLNVDLAFLAVAR